MTKLSNEKQIELRTSGYVGEFELSELIAACGGARTFDGDIFFLQLQAYEKNWEAKYMYPPHHEVSYLCESGTSPEEAVANLWLSLNKK